MVRELKKTLIAAALCACAGRLDLAEQALEATLKFSVSAEYIVGERYHDANPWYFPWSPNASGSGRIVRMLFGIDGAKRANASSSRAAFSQIAADGA